MLLRRYHEVNETKEENIEVAEAVEDDKEEDKKMKSGK